MADEEIVEKSELEKSRDIISQLKEMQHYAKSNIEKLTEYWLKFDSEKQHKQRAAKVEALLTQQNGFHDALETLVGEFEAECNRMEDKA
jgi:hypothetical protein